MRLILMSALPGTTQCLTPLGLNLDLSLLLGLELDTVKLALSPNLRISLLFGELRKHTQQVATTIARTLHTEEHIVPDKASSEHCYTGSDHKFERCTGFHRKLETSAILWGLL